MFRRFHLFLVALTGAIALSASVACAQELSVAGDLALSIKRDGASFQVTSGTDKLVLDVDGSRARVLKDGVTLCRGTKVGNTTTLNDASDSPRYVIEEEAAEYTIKEHGAKLFRVKVKDDKFNIYDASNQRVLHGKQKSPAWSVRKEDGSESVRIFGPSTLREASLLGVPLPAEYRLLWWALAK